MNKNDKRYMQTELLIRKNFIELAKNKPNNMITVSEICQAANINRSSFYLHYKDVNDLYSTLETEAIDFINATFHQYAFDGKINKMIDLLFDSFLENPLQIDFLLNVSKTAREKLINLSKEKTIVEWKKHSSFTDTDASIAYDFISGGMTAILNSWLENNFENADRYKELFVYLASEGLHYYVYKE